MPAFNELFVKKIKDFEVKVFDVALIDDEQASKLEEFLKSKVKRIKAFQDVKNISGYLKTPGIDSSYKEKFEATLTDIINPNKNKIPWFDIRRSYVTEFMSQLLLSKQFQCVFYEEADRRMNADAITIKKHSPGIDVTGVRNEGGTLKFVVCEVKASKDKIPTSSAADLLDDIKKSLTDESDRLSSEILYFMQQLLNKGEFFEQTINFLLKCLSEKVEKGIVLENVIFFPFLIRNNEEIVKDQNVDDYTEFGNHSFDDTSVNGIIWSFNKDIDDFCISIWENAVNEL